MTRAAVILFSDDRAEMALRQALTEALHGNAEEAAAYLIGAVTGVIEIMQSGPVLR